jgi:hypothetical protein
MVATVLLDTNVFTAWLKPRSPLVQHYGRHVYGHWLAICPAHGGRGAGSGDRRRIGSQHLDQLERLIRRRPLLVDDATMWPYACLSAQCHQLGHPLYRKGALRRSVDRRDGQPLADSAGRPRRGLSRLPGGSNFALSCARSSDLRSARRWDRRSDRGHHGHQRRYKQDQHRNEPPLRSPGSDAGPRPAP